MELYKLNLISKNNKERGSYFYAPILKIDNSFFFCRSIKSNSRLNPKDINVNELEITKEIPKEFYLPNGINI